MNKVALKLVSLVLCSAAAISAQQAEQGSPQSLPQQEQQPQPQVQQPQPQTQMPQPQPQLQPQTQAQQPQPQMQAPQPQVQLPQPQMQVQQRTDCSQTLTQPKFGLWAKFNLNSVSYGFNSNKNKDIDMGIGFGFGIVRRTPIIPNSLDVNPEIGFLHRNLYGAKRDSINQDSKKEEFLEDASEFVLSVIPVLAQFTPFEFPLYVAAGFQVDFPILAKRTTTLGNGEEETGTYGRAGYDLGVIYGIGYNITDRFSFNFRSVIGLRSITGKRSDSRTGTQYGLGVAFF